MARTTSTTAQQDAHMRLKQWAAVFYACAGQPAAGILTTTTPSSRRPRMEGVLHAWRSEPVSHPPPSAHAHPPFLAGSLRSSFTNSLPALRVQLSQVPRHCSGGAWKHAGRWVQCRHLRGRRLAEGCKLKRKKPAVGGQ